MNEQEVIEFMINSINNDNRELCELAGMSKEEADASIQKSQSSIGLLMSNLYERMKEEGFIA